MGKKIKRPKMAIFGIKRTLKVPIRGHWGLPKKIQGGWGFFFKKDVGLLHERVPQFVTGKEGK